MSQVRFFFGSLDKYLSLAEKNPLALYFIKDELTGQSYLYKGSELIAAGHLATKEYMGLMSAEDKAKLDALSSADSTSSLSPVDGTISITETESGKAIGVKISEQEGNALVAVEGGLFVPHAVIPEYSIEKQEMADEGFASSYKLKMVVDGVESYVGDTINIAKDMVLQSATLETVSEADVPYTGAIVGDPFIKLTFNTENSEPLYIPVKGLVDTYTAGSGIEIIDGAISVKIAENSHGLVAVDGAMTMLLASATQDGAMSKEDKAFIDSIPEVYASKKYVAATAEQIKYEVDDVPLGTLVNYGEDEIRIMCPSNAVFTKQSVGTGGDPNSYYMTFKVYAPCENAVGYIESLNGESDPEILTSFSTDEFGRRYQPTWLALARYDEASGVWNYYGNSSSQDKYIGWNYKIDWYNADGVMIASDNVRINLSNEDCHHAVTPYYISALKAEMNESMSWTEME